MVWIHRCKTLNIGYGMNTYVRLQKLWYAHIDVRL